MKHVTLYGVILLLFGFGCAQSDDYPIRTAHAHNDYEHDRPLLSALDNGFISVEADVHLINGVLYVSHDTPSDLEHTPTFESLYLQPLVNRIHAQDGRVYEDYPGFFYLMIDLKTGTDSTYYVLRDLLKDYHSIFSVVMDSTDQEEKPVKAIITTYHQNFHRLLLNDSIKYTGLDGRPAELANRYPYAWMPLISQNFLKYSSWSGSGAIDPKELYPLVEMIKNAHAQGKKVRLWGAPDFPEAWELLLAAGVDFINTDRIAAYRDFSKDRKRHLTK